MHYSSTSVMGFRPMTVCVLSPRKRAIARLRCESASGLWIPEWTRSVCDMPVTLWLEPVNPASDMAESFSVGPFSCDHSSLAAYGQSWLRPLWECDRSPE